MNLKVTSLKVPDNLRVSRKTAHSFFPTAEFIDIALNSSELSYIAAMYFISTNTLYNAFCSDAAVKSTPAYLPLMVSSVFGGLLLGVDSMTVTSPTEKGVNALEFTTASGAGGDLATASAPPSISASLVSELSFFFLPFFAKSLTSK